MNLKLGDITKRILMIIGASLLALNICALLIQWAWPLADQVSGFYSLTLQKLQSIPYWLLANLLLVVINGIGLLHHASIRAKRHASGGFEGEIPFTPLILIGYNLAAIPVLILIPRFIGGLGL